MAIPFPDASLTEGQELAPWKAQSWICSERDLGWMSPPSDTPDLARGYWGWNSVPFQLSCACCSNLSTIREAVGLPSSPPTPSSSAFPGVMGSPGYKPMSSETKGHQALSFSPHVNCQHSQAAGIDRTRPGEEWSRLTPKHRGKLQEISREQREHSEGRTTLLLQINSLLGQGGTITSYLSPQD